MIFIYLFIYLFIHQYKVYVGQRHLKKYKLVFNPASGPIFPNIFQLAS